MPNSPPKLYLDMNRDGVFTITDVWFWFGWLWDWFVWIFFLPGNFILELLLTENFFNAAVFFELSPAMYDGWFVGVVSLIIWAEPLCIIAIAILMVIFLPFVVSEWISEKIRDTKRIIFVPLNTKIRLLLSRYKIHIFRMVVALMLVSAIILYVGDLFPGDDFLALALAIFGGLTAIFCVIGYMDTKAIRRKRNRNGSN